MNRVSKSIFWNTVGSTVYLGSLWLLNILVVRLGNYAEAGILSLAISIANVVQSISLAGTRNYQVSDVKERYSNYTYIITRYLTSGIAFLGCIIFVILNNYSGYQRACIIVMSFYRIIDAFTDVYHGILQKNWRLDIVGKALICRGIGIVLAFSIILIKFHNLLYAIIGMIIVSFLLFALFEVRYTKKITIIDRILKWVDIKSLFKHTIPLILYSTLLNSISVVTRYYIEMFCGEELLGYYSSIASPALIVQVAATYIFNPLIGVFADLHQREDREGFNKLIIKCLAIIIFIILVAVVSCRLIGDLGLMVLFGKDILKYNYLLIPIVITSALTAVVLFLSMLLTILRNLKGLVISNVVGFVLNLVLSPIFMKLYSMQGANYSLIVALMIDMLMLLFMIKKDIKESL